MLAEAGTGVGKTLGYLAAASLWAERNGGTVWVSTYTRNLQAQIDGELDRLFPDPAVKAERVVLRKGRENYLCLLNLEEAARAVGGRPSDAIGLGIMARWALATKDGALVGGDLPGWLVDVLGRAQSLGLADRRGECIYSACPHYTKCFIEHSVRRARRAQIVVANHALVMVQAALGGLDDAYLPLHYVFDEGHHVFDAADSAPSPPISRASPPASSGAGCSAPRRAPGAPAACAGGSRISWPMTSGPRRICWLCWSPPRPCPARAGPGGSPRGSRGRRSNISSPWSGARCLHGRQISTRPMTWKPIAIR